MDKFKKTMVKSLAVILILAMCLGFAACELRTTPYTNLKKR